MVPEIQIILVPNWLLATLSSTVANSQWNVNDSSHWYFRYQVTGNAGDVGSNQITIIDMLLISIPILSYPDGTGVTSMRMM
jgi:hypothetical protein